MRKYIVIIFFFAGFINSFAQSSITPKAPANLPGIKDREFEVSVDVSGVTNLFGLSFQLDYNTRYLDFVSSSADPWFGNDLVYYAVPDEANGTVSIGVSRKYPAQGVSGSGSVVKLKFRLAQLPQIQNCELAFIISKLVPTDQGGSKLQISIFTGSSIVILPPDVPKLWSPSNGASGQATWIKLYWAKVLWAESYRLQISTDINFYSVLTDTVITDTLYYAQSLLSSRTYYWRVWAVNSGGTSIWSEIWSFITSPPKLKPDSPAELTPALDYEFDVSVNVTNVSRLFGSTFKLSYNTQYLKYVSAIAGGFLGGSPVFQAGDGGTSGGSGTSGSVAVGISRKYPQDGVSGSGCLALVRFKLKSLPQQKLTLNFVLSDFKMIDKDGNPVSLSVIDSGSTLINVKTDTSPWTQVISGLSTLNVVSMTTYLNKVYAATSTGGVFVSTDNGDSWTYLNYNNTMTNLRVNRLFNNYGSSSSLYACTDGGLFLSTMGSSSWVNLTQSAPANKQITCFASASPSDAKLIIGTRGNGVYKSNVSGTSWTPVSEGITNMYINDIITFTSGTSEVIMAGTSDGVFVTTDYGSIWKKKISGLSGNSLRITAFAYSAITPNAPTPNSGTVFISTQNGVFKSTDLGENWVPVLTDNYFYSIFTYGAQSAPQIFAVGPYVYFTSDISNFLSVSTQGIKSQSISGTANSQYIFMGTDGNGVYRKQKGLITSVEEGTDEGNAKLSLKLSVPDDHMLQQNYPNPFNPSTRITFSVPEAGYVKLKVFNVLGNEAAELVNEFKSPGTYSVQFSAANLPSGMYVYRLEMGERVWARKMNVIK